MFFGKLLRTGAVAATVLAGLQLDAAADPITYDGTLLNGVTALGDIGPGDPDNALQADYWRFWATAGDNITVTTRRVDGAYDPFQHVFGGIYVDTTDLGLTNGTNDLANGTNHLGFGDDELPAAVSGPFGDPETMFIAAVTGWYTVAVTEFLSGALPTDDEDYDYGITVLGNTGSNGSTNGNGIDHTDSTDSTGNNGNNGNPVPEPTLLALLTCGASGVALSRRRKSA